ncbi:MAG TPA: hypothetical protein VGB00_11525 [Pyrinomonadaceae bacterium]
MQKLSPQSRQNVCRAVLLLGVLAGLLFSCGEGIRLFPFPPEATENKNSGWKSGETIVYQKNLHRFENKQSGNHSKTQRDDPHQYWTSPYRAAGEAPLSFFSSAREIDVLFDSAAFKSTLFYFSGGSRAPPRLS